MKTGQENPKKWTPPEDAVSSNGAAVAEAPWTPPADAIASPLKKKGNAAVDSANGTPEDGLLDTSAPVQPEDVPSGEPINELQKQIEQKRQENIEKVQATEIPYLDSHESKIPSKLKPLSTPKLGGEPKGLGELGADILRKDFATQKDSLQFLADQNNKLLGSIKEAGKITPIKADQTIVKPLIKVPDEELAANELQFQDQEAARIRQETKAKEDADTGLGLASSWAGTFDQQVVNTFANILKSGAIGAANTIGRLGLSGQFGKATDPTQDWAYQLADWVEKEAKEVFPENPAVPAKIVPEVAGTLFSFMLGGALGKTTRLADLTIPSASKAIMRQTAEHIPAAFMASASTAAEEYERSLQATGDPETAFRTWERDMFTGVPFLISPTFRAFNKATDGALKYGVKQFAQGGIAGGLQMSLVPVMTNLNAQQTYDKSREIMEGVIQSGGSGFAINGVLTALLAVISHKAIGATGAEKAIYEQNIRDIQAQREYTKSLGNTDYYKPVGGVESGFKGMEGRVATPSGDIGLKMPEIISKAKNEIKSSSDTPTIEAKAEEIIDAVKQIPVEGVVNDIQNKPGLPSEVREGQEPVKAEPEQGGGAQTPISDRIFQNASKSEGEKIIPEPIPKDLKKLGEPVASNDDAKARFGAGERIFAFHEQGGAPIELFSVEKMDNFASDQLLAYPKKEPPLPEAKEGAKPIAKDEEIAKEGPAPAVTPEGSKAEGLPEQPSVASELTPEEATRIENITDPEEIARRYDEEARNPKGTEKDNAIANILSGIKVSQRSIDRWDDKNVHKHYISDDGADIDTIAQEASLSLSYGKDGEVITPDDVVEYMATHPDGPVGSTPKSNPLLMELNNRHIELTGKGLNQGGANGRAERAFKRDQLAHQEVQHEALLTDFGFNDNGTIDYKKAQEFLSSASAKDFQFPWDLTEAQFEQLKEYVDEKSRSVQEQGNGNGKPAGGGAEQAPQAKEEAPRKQTPAAEVDEAAPPSGSNALPSEPPGQPPQTPPPAEGKEPPIPEPEQIGAGIKKALVPEEKVAQMETQLENRTNEEFLEQGKKDVESGDIDPVALVNDVVGNHRALQTHEVAALVYYKAKMDNRFDDLNIKLQKIKSEGGDPGEAKSLNDQLKAITEERDRFHEMQLITAREQGRAFGLRKMMLDNEYNLLSQINQYKAQSADGEIPPAVMEHFKVQDEIIRKANERIAALEGAAEQKIGKETEEAIRKTVKKERVPGVKRGKALIDEGLNELKGIKWDASTGIIFDPKREAGKQLEQDKKVIKALSKIGKGMIQEGLATVEDVAAKLKEYIQDKLKGLPFDKYEKSVVDTITASLPRPIVKEGKLKIPKSIIHDLVEDGIDTIEDLTTAIHNMVKAEHPGITERQVRDAITDYGKMANLSKDEIDTKVRELKRVGKRISMLEDLKKKLRPLRSGLQRDKPTDKERAMDREIRDALKDLPEDVEETARVWKTAIEGTKTRLKNQITDLEEQIATGKKTPKKKGIVYDEAALALQAKRDELRDQLQAIEGKPELSDEQRLRMAVTAAEKSLKDYERRIKEADFAAKTRKTPVESQELTEIKARRDAAKEQLNKVREELGVADLDRLAKAKEAVKKSQENYERRLKEGEFTSKERPKIIDSELEKAMIARDKAKFEFDVAQEKNRLANRSTWEKFKDVLAEAFDLSKTLTSSFDISAVGRQGILLSTAHPTSAKKAMGEMFKKMASKEYNEKWFHRLQQSDIYPQLKRSKLYIAEPHAKLTAREEGFVSKYTEKIPGIAISNRAYAGYLNSLRVDVFAKGVDILKDAGYTEQNNPQAFKDWASFINNATGRGNLGKFGEAAAPLLNRFLFSPRLLASRFNIMKGTLTGYAGLDPKVRMLAMGDTLKFISFGLTVLGIAAAAGAEVELDPRSTDFMKMKIGNTRYDIWGGFQSLVRTIAQLASGHIKMPSGKIQELNSGEYGAPTYVDVIGKFFRGKESPTIAAAHNIGAGTNLIKEPVTPQGEALRLMIPLYAQDIASLYQSEGISGVAKGTIPALVGIGVQSYPSSGVEKDTPTAKVSADHDYYFTAPGRYSATFATPPTAEQYKNFVTIRGEEIQKQFEEHKESLSKLDNEHYKKRMDHFVKRATNKALFKAGIPEKNHREVPVAEEVY